VHRSCTLCTDHETSKKVVDRQRTNTPISDRIVKVYISDIGYLSSHTAHLASKSEQVRRVALYKPRIQFNPEGIKEELRVQYYDPSIADFADGLLVKKVDKVILDRFPQLRDQPNFNSHYIPMQSVETTNKAKAVNGDDPNLPYCLYCLYRLIAPPTHAFRNSIVFLGASKFVVLITNMHIRELWAVAYLDGKIPGLSPLLSSAPSPNKSEEEPLWDTTLPSCFGKWRHPTGYGERFPDFVVDAVPYWDLVLGDLGLHSMRKGGGAERDLRRVWTLGLQNDSRRVDCEASVLADKD